MADLLYSLASLAFQMGGIFIAHNPKNVSYTDAASQQHKEQTRILCVSIWRSEPEEHVPGETTGDSEISLSAEDLRKVFGQDITAEEGIDILSTLQSHRSAGTLDHKIPFADALVVKGLAYLRTVNPIDENAAIIARIDRDMDRIPQTNVERSPHAISQFDKLKQENEAKSRLEEAQHKAEADEKINQMVQATPKNISARGNRRVSQSNDLVGLRPEPEWVRRYRENATMQDVTSTIMPIWRKLVPSAAVVVTVVSLSMLFVQTYTPPSKNARLWSEIPPAAATVITLIGLNSLVFLMWRIPMLWKFLNRNFIVVPLYPYATSMLGAPFSHQRFSHLVTNMIGLWLIGTRVHDDIGRGPFLALYFSSGAIAAYVPMTIYILTNSLRATTLGVSAVVCALFGTYCVLHEGTTIHVSLLPSIFTQGIDTGALLGICILYEVWCIRKHGIKPPLVKIPGRERPDVDNMGHLTGYLAGIGAGAIIRSKDPKWKDIERRHFYTEKPTESDKSAITKV
ncbi:hypothetical protein ACLMJK_004158 [Lecanora helva]